MADAGALGIATRDVQRCLRDLGEIDRLLPLKDALQVFDGPWQDPEQRLSDLPLPFFELRRRHPLQLRQCFTQIVIRRKRVEQVQHPLSLYTAGRKSMSLVDSL